MAFQTVFKSEKEFEEFKTWTLGLLHDEHAKNLCITFTKKDGTVRNMRCTLCAGQIPTDKTPTNESKTTQNTTAARVFDIEKQEWRSFRWDNVSKVTFDL